MQAAFFDLDNTLVRGASLFHVARDLMSDGRIDRRTLARAAAHHALYRVTAREHGVDSAKDRGLELIEGMQVTELEQWCMAAVARVLPTAVYPGSLSLLRAHQSAGHRTYVATAAPIQVASAVAALLGCTGAVGTEAAHVDGVFTGGLQTPVLRREHKAHAVALLAAREDIDLARSSAYSDSHNDLPMLALVGDPHAVNPDGRLRRQARRSDWPVHDVSRRHQLMMLTGSAAAVTGAVVGARLLRGAR